MLAPSRRGKQQLNVRVSRELYAEIKKRAALCQMTLEETVRAALRMWLRDGPVPGDDV